MQPQKHPVSQFKSIIMINGCASSHLVSYNVKYTFYYNTPILEDSEISTLVCTTSAHAVYRRFHFKCNLPHSRIV